MGMVKVKSAKIRINAFRGDEEIELLFPEGWERKQPTPVPCTGFAEKRVAQCRCL